MKLKSLQVTEEHNLFPTPFIGKYVLESLSVGMYDHPLMALREYVQNSADAIDDFRRMSGMNEDEAGIVEIMVDGRKRCLRIWDNGSGIPSQNAWPILHDLGSSRKSPERNRGFRGIGRLGGLGYCQQLRFITKASGERLQSISTWNCARLRAVVGQVNGLRDAASVIEDAIEFEQSKYGGSAADHFFVVEMNDVHTCRNLLLSVPLIKSYLAQVAPIPFSKLNFRFGEEIEEQLRKNVPSYETYHVSVNGESIYKPYTDAVKTSKRVCDVKGINFFTLANEATRLAFGWLAELDFLGSIGSSTLVDGLRVRIGNMLVGNRDLLSEFYREARFNNYMLGEVHIVEANLIPNARRDDFEDNIEKTDFYASFAREIGMPYSKRIRGLSEERSGVTKSQNLELLLQRARRIAEHGFLAESQKQQTIADLQKLCQSKQAHHLAEKAAKLIEQVRGSTHVLSNTNYMPSDRNPGNYEAAFEVIYREVTNKAEAEAIISRILTEVLTETRPEWLAAKAAASLDAITCTGPRKG